ncbi:MAG: ABC-ATPase domain-containing protein [Bacillota bacterium]
MRSTELQQKILELDGKGYGAYKCLVGTYRLELPSGGWADLFIDHVQPDPYAPPSRMRLRVPIRFAGLPEELRASGTRRIALQDFLARSFKKASAGLPFHIDAGGQEILERSAVKVLPGAQGYVEARISVDLPAAGRRVLGRRCSELLVDRLPRVAAQALVWVNLDKRLARLWVAHYEDQEFIRSCLEERGLVAFVGEGSNLARESGISDRPMPCPPAVKFKAPPTLLVEFQTPNSGLVQGMGIPRGVTVIVGGGYHGKSTLLRALERGVYAHIPGDGREWVVTHQSAVKIRAEDGRSVAGVNISAFIGDLPGGVSTVSFDTDGASGSTSQAANIVEAIEAGAKVLLLDEDTCATNFMTRDLRMEELMKGRAEPITPFIDRVRQLYTELGVSCVLVMGGCGDYFEAADTVILMQEYRAYDVTQQALEVAKNVPGRNPSRSQGAVRSIRDCLSTVRYVDLESIRQALLGNRGDRPKVRAKGTRTLIVGSSVLDLWGLEQLVDASQTRAIGCAMALLAREKGGRITMEEALDRVAQVLEEGGLDALSPFPPGQHPGDLAIFRRLEFAAALNRLRGLRASESANELEDAAPGD